MMERIIRQTNGEAVDPEDGDAAARDTLGREMRTDRQADDPQNERLAVRSLAAGLLIHQWQLYE